MGPDFELFEMIAPHLRLEEIKRNQREDCLNIYDPNLMWFK